MNYIDHAFSRTKCKEKIKPKNDSLYKIGNTKMWNIFWKHKIENMEHW